MSKRINNAATYILQKNKEHSITLGRLINLLYLIDWKHSLIKNNSYSSIKWYVDNDRNIDTKNINKLLRNLQDIEVDKTDSAYKNWIIKLKENLDLDLKSNDKKLFDYTLKFVSSAHIEPQDLVQMTYPVFTSNTHDQNLDLPQLSREYKTDVKPQIQQKEAAEA